MIRTLNDKTVKARKQYRCGLCELAIEVGEDHYAQRNADDTQIWTWRAHTACVAAFAPFLGWVGLSLCDLDDGVTIPSDEFRGFLAARQEQ